MTWQQYREEWVKFNTCKFCIGNYMHTCTSFQCKSAIKKAEEYFDRAIEQEEIRRMKRKYVTDLHQYFTENLKVGNVVTGAWLISDEEKKEIIIKFSDRMLNIERVLAIKLIGKRFIEADQREKEKEDSKRSFGELLGGMPLREWRKGDEIIIRNGIPYEIKTEAAGNE